MLHSSTSSLPQYTAAQGRAVNWRGFKPWLLGSIACLIVGGIWFGIPQASWEIRVVFVTFALAIFGWTCTNINDTYIALAAAVTYTVLGLETPEGLFASLGDSTIWMLFAAFVVAAAFSSSRLSAKLTTAIATRGGTITRLFYLLTLTLVATAFVIPATSGRAALMLPVFLALSSAINNQRITRALALLFPSVILLSAVASLTGAGAHLVALEILGKLSGTQISYGQWMLLGLPFALISCLLCCFVILHLFLSRSERQQRIDASSLASQGAGGEAATSSPKHERWLLLVVVGLVAMWATEQFHGIDGTLVAVAGALLVTLPGIGTIGFAQAMKKVDWNLLLFMAATIKLAEAMINSGAAAWLLDRGFSTWQAAAQTNPTMVIGGVIGVSLLTHLMITSRTARSSVLVPLVILFATSLGYNAAGLVFLSTAAAGYCLTLTVSAKPLVLFSQVEQPTFAPRDLLTLSAVLLPLHAGLLMVFGLYVWPLLGLPVMP